MGEEGPGPGAATPADRRVGGWWLLARGGRAWWAQHPGAVSPCPCPAWLAAPRLGHSPGEGQEETGCVWRGLPPREGCSAHCASAGRRAGLGWAGLTFSRRGIPRDGGARQPHKAQRRPLPTPGRAGGPSLSVPTCHCPDWLSLAVNSRRRLRGRAGACGFCGWSED